MPHHEVSVDVYGCVVVHRPEVEQDVLALPAGGDCDCALIPHTVYEVGVGHAAQFAFGAERHGYLAVEAFGFLESALAAGKSEVKGVGPCSVQVLPDGTLELRARVFRARGLRCGVVGVEGEQRAGGGDKFGYR